jgi:hypothetical protein
LEQEHYEAVKTKLYKITPSLVDEIVLLYQQDPDLVARLGDRLRVTAEERVVALRDVLLSTLQLDYPPVMSRDLKWLQSLLEARHINPQIVYSYLRIFRTYLINSLPPEYIEEVLSIYDPAIAPIMQLEQSHH